MAENTTVVVGNLASDVRLRTTERGHAAASFRMATTERRYDARAGAWVDGHTSFFTVTCWRSLAQHVEASLSKGDPVVVAGRARVRSREYEGRTITDMEIDAHTVGHDLTRGVSLFTRSGRLGAERNEPLGAAGDPLGRRSVEPGGLDAEGLDAGEDTYRGEPLSVGLAA